MITTFFITIGANFYTVLLGLLPSGTLPSGVSASITYFISLMYRFNALLPVDTLFSVLGAFVVLEAAIVLFDLLMWILRKIPLVNIK